MSNPQTIQHSTARNRRALIFLFTANGISGFAQGITMLAVPWYFAQRSISSDFNLMYGIITMCTIVWGVFAGTIVDRFNRRKIFLLNNGIEGVVLALVAIYGWTTGAVPVPLIIIAFATTIFGFYLHYPNLYAFAQEISVPEEYRKVTSLIEIVGQSTNVLAGALAAVLLEGLDFSWAGLTVHVEPWTIYQIFTMDACTYVIAVFLIWQISYDPVKPRVPETGQLVKRLKTGLNYLSEHKMIFLFGVSSHVIFVVMLVKLHALMPMYISNHLGEGGLVFGVMEVLYAIGALSAGLLIRRIVGNDKTVQGVITLIGLATLALLVSAVSKSVGIFFIVGLVIGFTNAGTRVLRLSYIFEHVPNVVIGRVNSIFSIINVMMRVFFILLFSHHYFEVDSNITIGYAIMGTFTAMAVLVLLVNRRKLAEV